MKERSLDILAGRATSVRAAFLATDCLSVLVALLVVAFTELDLAFPPLSGAASLSATTWSAIFVALALGRASSDKALAEAFAVAVPATAGAAGLDADAFTACVAGALTTSGLRDFADLGVMEVRSFREMDGVMTA